MDTNLDERDSLECAIAAASSLRSGLIKRYAIECEFLGVPVLARILGIGETTLYEYIRCGRLAMPHRMFNKTPKIRLDDLAAWIATGANILKERRDLPPTRRRRDQGVNARRGGQETNLPTPPG